MGYHKPRKAQRARFNIFLRRRFDIVVSDSVAQIALGAVRLRPRQASAKLSPVEYFQQDGQKRIRAISPFCASTYVSFESCPSACPLKSSGCYVAANVNMARAVNALDRAAQNLPVGHRQIMLVAAELWLVATYRQRVRDGSRSEALDLRLHVVGDIALERHAVMLAEAEMEWSVGGDGTVWTFTRSWRSIRRSAWGDVSVMASVDTAKEMPAALARGYAPAVVVAEFPDGKKPFGLPEAPDVKVLPCPHEAGVRSPGTGRAITCVECRMCLEDSRLVDRRAAIAFAAHGRDREQVLVSLGLGRSDRR